MIGAKPRLCDEKIVVKADLTLIDSLPTCCQVARGGGEPRGKNGDDFVSESHW